MDNEFWACSKCGDFVRGSASVVMDTMTGHRAECPGNNSSHSMERTSIDKIMEGLKGMLGLLPPPPPPPPPPSPLPLLPTAPSAVPTKKSRSAQRKENMDADKSKMPIDVANELNRFIKWDVSLALKITSADIFLHFIGSYVPSSQFSTQWSQETQSRVGPIASTV